MPYLNPDELEMDYGLDPRKPMLPRALGKSPGGVLSQTVKPGEAQALTLPQSAAKYSQRANDLYDQGSRMMMSEPDVSSLQAFAKQRSQEGEGAMLNALAAQYAGENFQPLQAQFLKKATAAQDPLKVGNRGYITPQGSFVKDPTYTQEKQAEFLMQQAARYEQLAANATTAAERAEAMRAQQEVLNQMRMMGLQIQQGNQAIAQGNLDLRRDIAANRQPDNSKNYRLEDSMRHQFENLTKPYREELDATGKVTQLVNAIPPGSKLDTQQQASIIILLNKFLDPGSVVREGEFDRVVKQQGLLARVELLKDRIAKGGFLTPETVGQINNLAQFYSQAADTKMRNVAGQYADVANRRGLDVSSVITNPTYQPGAAKVVDFNSLPTGKGK